MTRCVHTPVLPRHPSLRACTFAVALAATAVLPETASAAPTPSQKIKGRGGRFGFGLSLGDPMGGTIKYFMAANHALQADIGWAPMHHGVGRLGADYLWHPGTFVSTADLDFLPYLGFGVGMAFWAGRCRGYYYYGGHGRGCDNGGVAMFLRVPVLGLGIHWKKAPLDTMLEGSWSPFIVLPDLPHGDVSFKIRYYF